MARPIAPASADLARFLKRSAEASLLRFSTAGSVDDGKSTLIGRLLHDSKNIYEDQLDALRSRAATATGGGGTVDLALLTDGLRAEREQGITIDVAYRYFSTPRRRFILADTPGHEQYTRNMATGASTADLTIVLVDARNGVVTQTRRHAFIAALMGVPRLLVAVNKMDLVDYRQEVFDAIRADFEAFASRLGVRELRFIPVAAIHGDNVVEKSARMPWYHGETVMEHLEGVYIAGDTNLVDFRFPVQYVLRPHQNYRGYAGQIASGIVHVGDEITVLPSLKRSRIRSIDILDTGAKAPRGLAEAAAPLSVTLTLEHEVDIARGDMLVRSHNMPALRHQFEAMLVWMHETPMDPKRPYLIRHTTRETKAFVEAVSYRVDVNTLSREAGAPLALNEIGRVALTATAPLMLDAYQKNRATGNFVLVDASTFHTVAAGMVIERMPEEMLPVGHLGEKDKIMESRSLHGESGLVSREMRESRSGMRACTLWLTGLSGSGKSTVARSLEQRLFGEGRPVFRLDGDVLRVGLNKDLGFSKEERAENIRRAAEAAKLLNEAGVSVICSFISPFEKDRALAREIIGADRFVEVYLNTPLSVCEERDPHGLYRKARSGALKEFTGVSSPYEAPAKADVTLDTSTTGIDAAVETLHRLVVGRFVISGR